MLHGLLLGASAVCVAHHSYASYDMKSTAMIQGVVSEWEWTNPHSFLHLSVSIPGGDAVEWNFESSSPALLARHGFTRDSFRAGDSLTVVYHPNRELGNAGSLVTATFADGHALSVLNGAVGGEAGQP